MLFANAITDSSEVSLLLNMHKEMACTEEPQRFTLAKCALGSWP